MQSVRNFISQNGLIGFLSAFYVLAHKMTERACIFFVKKIYSVDKSVIILKSTPDYSDNARALAEYMVKNGYTNKYKIYFDVSNLEYYKNRIDGVTFISSKSEKGCFRFSYLRLIFTAKYLLCTHSLIIDKRLAQKGQCIVRLWHGCGYKTKMRFESKKAERFDAALVSGPLFVKVKAEFWSVDEKYILPIGYPRYDWFKTKDNDAIELINSFKKDEETKVVMWMPTFRKSKYSYVYVFSTI